MKYLDEVNKLFKLYNEKLKLFYREKFMSAIGNIFNKENIKGLFTMKFFLNTIFSILGISLALGISYQSIKLQDSKKYSIATNKAEEYFYAGAYDEAIQEYIKISKTDKLSPIWDAKISEVYSVKGDIENSRKYIDKVRQADSKDGDVLNYIVFTEFMNRDYSTALEDGEDALKIAGSNKSLIKTMFTVYMANNQMDKAKKLLSTYPIDAKSSYDTAEYARMLMILGDWNNGYKELKEAWKINKDEYKIYDVLAQIALYNRDKLLEDVSKLSTDNPNEVVYKMWLAKVYSSSDTTAEEGAKILDKIKNEDVGKIEIKLIEASILQNTGKGDKADELLNNLIKQSGNDYTVLHTAGWFYLNKKDYTNAERYCKESILKNKDYPDNYAFLMPEILKAQGKSSEGEPYFRTAMLKEPYNYNIMLNIANYYWYTTKNSEKALKYFKFAEIVKPDDAEIKYNMALIQLSNNNLQEAIDILKQCIKMDDRSSKYHRTLGTIYMTKGDTKSGIAEIRYAYNADESDVLALNNAGCYYITVEENYDRGLYNFMKAAEGLRSTDDKYTKDTITENYNKAKKFVDQYKNGKGNEAIKVPDFVLFY